MKYKEYYTVPPPNITSYEYLYVQRKGDDIELILCTRADRRWAIGSSVEEGLVDDKEVRGRTKKKVELKKIENVDMKDHLYTKSSRQAFLTFKLRWFQ